jgi:hypothetical protein
MAGGVARFVERNGRRELEEDHRYFGQPLAKVRPELKREPTEQIEFHCALVRREVFDRLGPLDERLWSAAEHTDLCLMVREAGGQVYLEPNSVVTYVAPPPFTKADLDYYMLRWSDAWNIATLAHFRAKWQLAADDPSITFLAGWLDRHRRIAWHRVESAARLFGKAAARWLQTRIIGPLELAINRARYPHVLSHRASPPKYTGAGQVAAPAVAQTNLQLYNQMLAAGRSEYDLRRVREAYELAMRLFAGQYRANGKPFVAHLVGVASILAAQDRPVETIVAGLLHSVYSFGEFGDGTRGASPRKRRQVRAAVGDVAEQLAAHYASASWELSALEDLERRTARLSPLESGALEIKLADVLEDHVDGGTTFAPFKEYTATVHNGAWAEALARAGKLAGHAGLAAQLRAAAAHMHPVPGCLVHERHHSFVVAPLSHRERIALLVSRTLHRNRHARRAAA